jgi:hypothetical protein
MFAYEDPEAFRETVKALRAAQKAMVKAGAAIRVHKAWKVNNSAKEGEKFAKNISRLALQAFNGECDALIGKVNTSNWERAIERINNSQVQLNKIIAIYHLELMDDYVRLRVNELRATYELERRRAEIKAQEAEARAQMREEAKREQEVKREIQRLAAETAREERALEAARQELEASHGQARDALLARIEEMQREIDERNDRARTISMAEQTRTGHVYIVSNVGAFGQNVFKVGMTRRLDPLERIKELSDASVPFPFDVHAMIRANDAPALEAELHRALEVQRVNRVNMRKEFFRVDFGELVKLVNASHGEFEYVRTAVAEEFRQTLAVLQAEANAAVQHHAAAPALFEQSAAG